jgi:uncharacterized membrane protein
MTSTLNPRRAVTSRPLIDAIDQLFEVVGVLALVVGAFVAGWNYLAMLWLKPAERSMAYSTLRRGLGRAILIGLELLVAADIIRTVAIEPSLQNVAVLGLIVVIRTFLSWSLEVEIDGHWPWQSGSVPRIPTSPYPVGTPGSTIETTAPADG